jgi:cyanophycinase
VPDPTKAGMPRRRCSDRNDAASDLPVESGTLIIIGGNEDKAGDRLILSEVAARAHNRCMVVATVASSVPEENWLVYQDVFCTMGVARVEHLDIPTRSAAFRAESNNILQGAGAVFFTGGDQGQIMNRTRAHRSTTQFANCMTTVHVSPEPRREPPPWARSSSRRTEWATSIATAGIHGNSWTGLAARCVNRSALCATRTHDAPARCPGSNPALFGIGIDEDTAIVVAARNVSLVYDGKQRPNASSNLGDP